MHGLERMLCVCVCVCVEGVHLRSVERVPAQLFGLMGPGKPEVWSANHLLITPIKLV